MSDNQKFIIIAIIICTILALLVSLEQKNLDHKVNYDYYVVTDANEYDSNKLDGYKISNNISTNITEPYVRLELSALLDYNLNIKTSQKYSGDFFQDYSIENQNNFIITTAINTLYKSDLLIHTTKEEKENDGYDYKITSLSVDRIAKIIFGDIEYDKNISTEEIVYNQEKDIYYYKINKEDNNNHIETKLIDVKENAQIIEVEIAIAYLNYTNDKVYRDKYDRNEILKTIDENELFKDIDKYPKYILTFTKDSANVYHFQSIKPLLEEN